MQYGLIMAGGSGTRLWPLSRKNRPKQLLPLIRGKSLLQLAYERLRATLPPDRIYVCTKSLYASSIFENLPELPKSNLLGEPEGRDTANAVGFAAAVLQKQDPEAVMAIVTADHVIEPVEKFQSALQLGFDLIAENRDALVTFGIVPNEGHTGLGYIHRGEAVPVNGKRGAWRVLAFREKPDKATADRYVESGRYYWNSGMFVWRAETVLRELALHLPEAHRGLMAIAEAWGTSNQQDVLQETYPRLPRISIDYAVMEPASLGKGKAAVYTVEMPVNWLDVGSWPSLADTLKLDEQENAADCDVCVLIDCDNNILVSHDPDHLVAAVGVSDMIIVHTKDVTMVCPKRDAQRVKELVARSQELYGDKFQEPMRTLGIDLGGRRVGLALSDEGGRFATPYQVLSVSSAKAAIGPIVELVRTQSIQRIVLGLPINMDDTLGPAARGVIAWSRGLAEKILIPIVFVDERLSSFEAEEQLTSRRKAGEKLSRQRKKEQRDALAAACFLQAFLDGKLAPLEEGDS